MSIRHLFLWGGLTGLGCGLLASPVWAADAPTAVSSVSSTSANTTSLSLAQVLQAARANPDVMAALRNLEAARADVLAANRAPAPTLSAGVSSIDLQNGVGAGSFWSQKRLDKSLGLDWTWERGNKRALRTEQAERLVQAAQADGQEALVLQQIGAQAAFYDLLTTRDRLQTVQALAQSAEQLAQTAERRLQAGDLSAQDAARTQIEAARARADLQSAQLDHQQATQWLSTWTGLPVPTGGWQLQGHWPAALPGTAPTASQMDALLEQRTDVLAARARVAAAQSALQSAQALRSTDPSVGASFDHIPGTSGTTSRLLAFRMSVPLTLGHRYDGEIQRAVAQEEQSRDLLQKTLLQARADLNTQVQSWLASAERLKIYESSILPQAARVAAQAETAYSKGGLPLTDLLDARRTLRATQLDALAVRNEHAKALGTWQLRQTASTSR